MPCSRSRRSFLRASGATAASLSLAGCSELRSRTQGLRLGNVVLHNWHSESHDARVEVERNGEIVREQSIEIPGETEAVMEATWPDDPAVYTLYYVVVGPAVETDIRTTELTSQDSQSDGSGCTIATLEFGMQSGAGLGLNLGPSDEGTRAGCNA